MTPEEYADLVERSIRRAQQRLPGMSRVDAVALSDAARSRIMGAGRGYDHAGRVSWTDRPARSLLLEAREEVADCAAWMVAAAHQAREAGHPMDRGEVDLALRLAADLLDLIGHLSDVPPRESE